MKRQLALCFSLAAITGLAACGSSDGGSTPTGTGALRVANGIYDSATSIDAVISGVSTQLNADFGTGSGFADIPEGSYKVTMNTTYNGGSYSIVADGVEMTHDVQTTVYAVGQLASQTQTSFVVTRPTASFASGMSEVQFVNASSATAPVTGIVDIYLVPPGTGLTAPYLGPVAVRSQLDTTSGDQGTAVFTAPTLITSGTYEVIVTGADGVNVLYDSGPSGIAFASGQTLQIALMDVTVDEIQQYGAPMQLVFMDNSTGTSTAYFNQAPIVLP